MISTAPRRDGYGGKTTGPEMSHSLLPLLSAARKPKMPLSVIIAFFGRPAPD